MEIVSAQSNFDFTTASLADPQPLSGQAGFYFTQLSVGAENKSLCLQLPECLSKQGVINVKNVKYLDLMFERDKHDDLMKWVEKLEYTCQDIIDTKKELWFQTELTRDDIETMMTQVTRLYQSGKFVLMRVFIDINKTGQKCIAYDENEIGFDLDILEANKPIIPLIMIEGVKFSSRSFEISLKLVQVMVMGKYENKSACLIKRPELPPSLVNSMHKPMTVSKPLVAPAQVKAPTQAVPAQAVPAVVKSPMQAVPAVVKTPMQAVPAQAKAAPVAKAPAVEQAPLNKSINMLREKNTDSVGEKTLKSIIKNTTVGNTTVGNTTVGIKKVSTAPINLAPINLAPKKNDIEEININYSDISESISLKNPNEVYYEMYRNAREKAKECRNKAIEAYLEAKQIKTKYMLHDLEDSEDSDDENFE